MISKMALTQEREAEWFKNLQKYLFYKLLPLAEESAERRIKLVEQTPMLIWRKAFTHKSIRPTMGENYEELENLGDVVSKLTFTYYLTLRYGSLDTNSISRIRNFYLSTEDQSKKARALEIGNHILSLIPINARILEDVLEAFYGALLQVGDAVIGTGYGYILCYNFTVNLYRKEELDLSIAKGDDKTRVYQLFQHLGWGKAPIENWYQDADGTGGMLQVKYTKKALDFLRNELRFTIKDSVLAQARGVDKSAASRAAYGIAIRNLEELGIEEDYAEEIKMAQTRETELAGLNRKALDKARKAGYVSIKPVIYNTGANTAIVQLIGTRANGRADSLSFIDTNTGTSNTELHKQVFRKYVES